MGMMIALNAILFGMIGIFIVMGVIALSVYILNSIGSKKEKD